MAGKMSDVEYTVIDQWYRLLNNEISRSPTGFDLSADMIGMRYAICDLDFYHESKIEEENENYRLICI